MFFCEYILLGRLYVLSEVKARSHDDEERVGNQYAIAAVSSRLVIAEGYLK